MYYDPQEVYEAMRKLDETQIRTEPVSYIDLVENGYKATWMTFFPMGKTSKWLMMTLNTIVHFLSSKLISYRIMIIAQLIIVGIFFQYRSSGSSEGTSSCHSNLEKCFGVRNIWGVVCGAPAFGNF
jgi:hypothetical protein